MNIYLRILITISFILIALNCSEHENSSKINSQKNKECSAGEVKDSSCTGCPSAEVDDEIMNSTGEEKALITFIELGSVNCIPCKKMQPVMTAIEEKYKNQIKVIFYDVWKADQKKFAQQYNIRLIPTQVFLDANGNEIFRHEGFFPEKEIDAFLKEQGLISTIKS